MRWTLCTLWMVIGATAGGFFLGMGSRDFVALVFLCVDFLAQQELSSSHESVKSLSSFPFSLSLPLPSPSPSPSCSLPLSLGCCDRWGVISRRIKKPGRFNMVFGLAHSAEGCRR